MPIKMPRKAAIVPFGARTEEQRLAQQKAKKAADALVGDILRATALPSPKEQELAVIIGQYRDYSLKLLNYAFPEAGVTATSPDSFFFSGLEVLVNRANSCQKIVEKQKAVAATHKFPQVLGFSIDGVFAPPGIKGPDKKSRHWRFIYRGTASSFYSRFAELYEDHGGHIPSKSWFMKRVTATQNEEEVTIKDLELWACSLASGPKRPYVKMRTSV